MSASMYWRPVKPKPEGEYVDDALRHILARALWDQDGSDSVQPYQLDSSDTPYLRGLRDGGVPGAAELIDAIAKHGTIEIWIQR